MCPEKGVKLPQHKELGFHEQYESKTEFTTYYDTGRPRIQQRDAESNSAVPYVATVSGTNLEYTGGTGFTGRGGERAVSNGFPLNWTRMVFDENAKRSFAYEFDQGPFTKACGSKNKCIGASRFLISEDEFTKTGNTADNGKGLPYNGLQPLGHQVGSPLYMHRPFFLNGDEELYAQKNNSHVFKNDGNGINLYHAASYGSSSASQGPGSFTVGGTNANFKLVDKSWASGNEENFQAFIDIEPGSGATILSNVSFGFSQSFWECNPGTNERCKLAAKSKGETLCYKDHGNNYFSTFNSSEKSILTGLGRDVYSYPCSANNLFTPQVIAGKVMPMYWYNFISSINPKKVDPLVEDGVGFRKIQATFIVSFFIGEMAILLSAYLLTLKGKKTAAQA